MRHEPRERIKGLYDVLTGFGEEASKKIASRPSVEVDPPEERAVVVPPPRTTDGTSTVGTKSTTGATKPATVAKPVPTTSRKPLPIWNPLQVFFSALGIVATKLGLFLALGTIFVLLLGFTSLVQYERRSAVVEELRLVQVLFLALIAYILVGWIRVARSDGAQPFKKAPTLGHITVALVVAVTILFGSDWFLSGSRFDLDLQFAVYFTKFWPFYGPYGSMASPSLPIFTGLPGVPKPTIFLEPFAHVGAVIPILLFMPFVVGEYRSFIARWFIFLVKIPFVVVNLLAATVPIAILNVFLVGWTRELIGAASTRLQGALLLAAICYAQIVMMAAVIGECYRRVFNEGP